MKNSSRSSLIWLVFFLSGCVERHPVAWEAQREVKVYVDPAGDAQAVKFVLVAGDICVPGKEVFEKSYGYTEVICPKRGVGWVADPYFKVYDITHPNGRDMTAN